MQIRQTTKTAVLREVVVTTKRTMTALGPLQESLKQPARLQFRVWRPLQPRWLRGSYPHCRVALSHCLPHGMTLQLRAHLSTTPPPERPSVGRVRRRQRT